MVFLEIAKKQSSREFTRIMNSDLGWKPKKGDHFQQLNYLSCVYGGYKNFVPVIIDFVAQVGMVELKKTIICTSYSNCSRNSICKF